jgi:23S rRNA pseudouridine1911/1915/1917 synthase
LAQRLPGLSRSRVQALVRSGDVKVNGESRRPHDKVSAGMEVTVHVPPARPVPVAAEDIPLDVIHEDPDVIVVNKAAGLVVHPAAGHASGTLVNALLHHCGDLAGVGGELRPGIVHRLDKDTSGVMVVAKNDDAMASLVAQFKQGAVRKEYLAVVNGTPRPAAGTVETLIGRSRHDRKKMSARPARGREAVTSYEVVEELGSFALLRVRIETGRTHQIRVHLAHIGHPVVGDRQYGRRKPTAVDTGAGRQMLHAHRLGFRHPRSGEALTFEAPMPEDMNAVLERLRHG